MNNQKITVTSPGTENRDPAGRVTDKQSERAKRERALDKTLADSFPASDPPSSLPNPGEDSFSGAS